MTTLVSEYAPRAGARGQVFLQLLGSFRLEIGEHVVTVPTGAQRTLALLCLHGRTSRRRLSGALWPETTTAQALTNLRHVLWRLQQVTDVPLVAAEGTDLALVPEVYADVASLMGHAGPALDPCLLRPDAADLLVDWDDEWLVADRERLRQLRLHVLEGWAEALATEGRYGPALEAALAALRTDDLRESAHRAVIRVHLAEGNLSEARRALATCRRVLRAQVGVDPSPQTEELLGRAARETESEALRSLR